MAKFDSVGNDLTLCIHLDELEATVRVESRSNIKTVDSGEYGKKMIFESAYCSFGAIPAMHVWWNKLELGAPSKRYCLFEGRAGLVVHDL